MKTFVLIVTFAATTDLIGGARTERIASFDDYQACASAGRALHSQQRWECVPRTRPSRRTSEPLSGHPEMGRALASGTTPRLCRGKGRMITAANTAKPRGCSLRRRCSQR